MKFTKDNIKKIERFIEIKNRGYYANGNELQAVYNEVFEVNKPATNCGSCIRQRITELENALNAFKRKGQSLGFTDVYQYIDKIESEISSPVEAIDSVSSDEPRPSKGLEGNEVALPTVVKVEEENKPVVKKAGRPRKNDVK